MRKRTLMIFFILLFIAVFIMDGCGKPEVYSSKDGSGSKPITDEKTDDSKEPTPKEDTAAKLTVWIYGWETDSVKVLQDDAEEWEEANSNVTIELVPVAADTYNNKMQATLAGGTNPDIAFIDAGVLSTQLAAKGSLLALNDYGVESLEDKFYPALWDSFLWEGKVYGLRITSNNLALFYNKELFEEAGINYPEENWTWDDLRSAAKELTDPAKRQYGIQLPVYDDTGGYTWTWLPFLWQNGGYMLNDERTQAVFNSPEGKEALEFWYTLVHKDKSAPHEAPSQGVNRFTSENVAMVVDGPWNLRPWLQDPDFKDKLRVAPLPKQKERATVIGGEGLTIFSNTKYPQQAYDYIKHLTTDDDFVQKFWKAWFTIPPMVEYGDFYDDDPIYGEHMKIFVQQMEVARSRQFTPTWPQIEDALGLRFGEYMYKGKPVDQALDEAVIDINKLLSEN